MTDTVGTHDSLLHTVLNNIGVLTICRALYTDHVP